MRDMLGDKRAQLGVGFALQNIKQGLFLLAVQRCPCGEATHNIDMP